MLAPDAKDSDTNKSAKRKTLYITFPTSHAPKDIMYFIRFDIGHGKNPFLK